MAGRRLTPEEQLLWGKVVQTERPIKGRVRPVLASDVKAEGGPAPVRKAPSVAPLPTERQQPVRTVRRPADYLDGSWEKRIARGALVPDMSIDLHGHSLDSAHRHLETALAAAAGRGARVLLVVTGKARSGPKAPGERSRGAIRAEIGHWLATSAHADAIASVRTAHPRHGGNGAIYLILRRNG